MTRKCWTCNSGHELDEACAQSGTMRTAAATAHAGFTSDLFDDVQPAPDPRPDLRAFPARYRSECGDCWGNIWPGDRIVGSDNGYVYVHEECALKEEEWMDNDFFRKLMDSRAKSDAAPLITADAALRIESLLKEIRDMLKEFMAREY